MNATMGDSLLLLVVDDEENDHVIARHYLKRLAPNVEVLYAFDGLEAIEILRTLSGRMPDLLLLDINMPRMNGHEFLEAWFTEQAAEVPIVVMLTSSDQHDDKRAALRYDSVKDYFLKPMTKSTVKQLEALLGGQDGAEPKRLSA